MFSIRTTWRPAALFLFSLTCAFAQAPTASLTGTVSDPSGAVIANASVVLTNSATGFNRTLTTNAEGVYAFNAVPIGVYTLTIEAPGFPKQIRERVELQVGQTARIDATLQVGNVAESIRVEGGAPLLQTETTEVGTVIENKRIVELPLNGRNYLQLASLIPGATTNGPASSQGQQRMGGARNSFALNVSGQRVHYNHYSLDGMENTDPNFNTYLFLPSIDALAEFKVEAGTFGAEYGRAIAQVNVSTKGGSNSIHGAVFEFLRNSNFDAKNYFDRGNQPIPPFKRNQYGVTVSGPIIRNKLFWMFSWDALKERKALTQTGVVAQVPFRNGDFSSLSTAINDPNTRVVANNVIVSQMPFPGNIIPQNRINPISKRMFSEFIPVPNQAGANNYINNEGRRQNNNQYFGRLDYTESASSTWFFRYSKADDTTYAPQLAVNTGNNVLVTPWQAVLANTRLFGATKVNEFRLGVNRMISQNIQQRANTVNIVKDLGIPDIDTSIPLFWGIPVFQFNGYSAIGECNDCPFVNYNTTFQIKDDFSWTKGRHSLKFGGDWRRLRYNQIGAVVPRGRFSFSGQYTGNSIADSVLGIMNNSEGQVGAPIANFRNSYSGLYLQDTWKVSRKLTLNLGVRWEVEPPFLDKHDAIVNIDFRWDHSVPLTFVRAGTGDPYAGNPPFRLPSTIPYVRDGRFGRRATRVDWNDFAPRAGLAYQVNDKTVVRASGGMYYVRDIGNAVFDVVRNAPFTIRRNEAANTLIPNLSFQRPFSITGAPTFILANTWNEPTSYVAQWTFNIQREITKDMSYEIAYLGSGGSHLRRLASYNDPTPGPGDIQARRPFPALGNVQVMYAPSHSTYHALQMKFTHRFSHGFTLLSSYAWNKSIDNGSGIRTTDGDTLTATDQNNLRRERGLSAFDFRHRWTSSFLYEMPFGKGKAIGGDWNRLTNALLGGWQIGGIFTFQAGFPATAYCGGGVVQNGGTGCYPDATGISPNLGRGNQDPARWFNTAAFIDRIGMNLPAQLPAEYRFGNSNRNTITGPGIINIDASLNKAFAITERHRVEFRFEVFNAPNHPNWGQPGTTLRTGTYGVIGSTRTDPRDIQLALKYVF
ncbi:MAG: TonB-dependent receptor [Acidobacteria bacterium]|nr:TonB-dependent receptor [Acidobacteriota bacterium]